MALVKDPVLSLWQLGPWPGNFHVPGAQPKKKKEESFLRILLCAPLLCILSVPFI